MTQLKARLQRLEAQAAPAPHTGCIRIIQRGALTPDQKHEIAEEEAQGKIVILRVLVGS